MKILVIELEDAGCGLGFVLRCVEAGHAVRYFIKKDYNQSVGTGFKGVERIDNWVTSIKWADLVWMTGNDELLERMDFYRTKGVKFFGPSAASAKLEIDREAGLKFLEKHGIECPAYETFDSLADAEQFARKSTERWVFKTLGSEEDKSLSYCAKSPADLVARLQRWQKMGMKLKGPCILQEFIEGKEFAVSSWMGTEGFISIPNENFEHKKLLSGNCGPNCGEAGTVMKYTNTSKLFDEVLYPLEDSLVQLGHLGDIDVNCIIDERGQAWPLEFTMRPGWPAMNIMLATHKGDPAQWMLDACNGEDTLEVSTSIAVGIVVAQPDYPYSHATKRETENVPIYGVTPKNRKHIAPQSVKVTTMPQMDGDTVIDGEMWATAGDYLAVVTGTGRSVKQAAERAYGVVKELDISDVIYRDDVGEKLKDEIPDLQKLGYAVDFTYE